MTQVLSHEALNPLYLRVVHVWTWTPSKWTLRAQRTRWVSHSNVAWVGGNCNWKMSLGKDTGPWMLDPQTLTTAVALSSHAFVSEVLRQWWKLVCILDGCSAPRGWKIGSLLQGESNMEYQAYQGYFSLQQGELSDLGCLGTSSLPVYLEWSWENIGIICELFRKANSWARNLTYWVQISGDENRKQTLRVLLRMFIGEPLCYALKQCCFGIFIQIP